MLSCFSPVQLCVTLWTVAYQVPLLIGFCSQKHWSGLPCSPSRDLPYLGIEPASPEFSALQSNSLLLSHRESPHILATENIKKVLNTLAKTHNTLFTNVIFKYVLFIFLINPLKDLYLGGKHKR